MFGLTARDNTAVSAAESQADIAQQQAVIATQQASAAQASSTLSARWAEAGARKNYCLDGDGSQYAALWSSGVNTGTDQPASAPAGSRCLQFVADGAYQNGIAYKWNPQGKTMRVRCWIKPVQTTGTFVFALRTPTGGIIQSMGSPLTTNSDSWTYYEAVANISASSPEGWCVGTDFANSGGDVRVWDLVWEDITDVKQLEASVSVTQGAIASIENTAAFYDIVTSAGGGNKAVLRMLAGKNGSFVDIAADRFVVMNGSSPVPALSIVNGDATFSGVLNVGGTTGERFSINKNRAAVYDSNNVQRVFLGLA